jgi:hypothetical protein
VLAGIVVPLGIEWSELSRKIHAPLLVPVLVLIGGLVLRFVMVSAGQALGYSL